MPTDSSEYKPTKKECVSILMDFLGKETDEETGVTYLKYRCPKPNCTNPVVRFRDNTGFSNPYSHLLRCFTRGKPAEEKTSIMIGLFNTARNDSKISGASIRSHFTTRTTSDYEKAIYGYLRLVVMKSLPLSIIEDAEFRSFAKYNSKISYRTLSNVLLRLVSLVKKKISYEMKSTRGAIIFDGWTGNDTDFVSVFASYCVESSTRVNFTTTTVQVPTIS